VQNVSEVGYPSCANAFLLMDKYNRAMLRQYCMLHG